MSLNIQGLSSTWSMSIIYPEFKVFTDLHYGEVWQTQLLPDQCFDWANAGKECVSTVEICLFTGLHSSLLHLEFKVLVGMVSANDTYALCAPLFHTVPQVHLKLPMLMDTALHVCGCEVKQNSRTKAKICSDNFRPKNGLRSHFRESSFKTFPSFCVLMHALW